MRTVTVALAAVVALGCARQATPGIEKEAPSRTEAAAPALAGSHSADSPSAMPGDPATGPSAAAPASVLTGTVLETMDAAGYTYMKLKTAEGETWAAVNVSKVQKGETVSVANPMPMDGFESKTLNRKFDHIVFGMLAAPAVAAAPTGGEGAPAGIAVPAATSSMAAQHAAAATGPEVTEKISVAKAEGGDGRTVAEVFAQRAALKGKSVSVRGKVVKFNSGIMGKNWIHLRDGSGTAEGKNNDVTVTTNDTAAKGDVVLVRGIVAIDRDFGSGYTYAVIVEDGKVTK
ncbi:MAG: OB-fold nucleic acid binding domain-containing protein [Deltaproteobacteria bacterium]|nr:OB-fold nucleic acid binding domain-containing protein [Deltaproteobacteria bacterium]